MDNTKHHNQASKPALTTQKPKATNKASPKSISSTKTTHGSLKSTSASNGNGNGDASSVNNQREAWALQHWLQQTPRDEPWRPGSRNA